jgi:hypothetical protein
MLTSYPNLDSTFCNPVVRTSSSSTTSGDSQELCFQLPAERQQDLWLGGLKDCAEDLLWWTEGCQQRDLAKDRNAAPAKKSEVMEKQVEPDDDLRILSDNELKLRLSGYYYGSLSWMDASHILKQSKVGTFLVRDSEHYSYLYSLSVQTKRGPTSCRIEYLNGRFRLDSSEELAEKMPRFESVTDLIDHYVHLTKNLPKKNSSKELGPVWLDMDEENVMGVPVQIYKPLYRTVRSLQHLCRVSLVRLQKEKYPSSPLSRTIDEHEYKVLPTVLKDYLKEYPYSQ